MAVESLLIATVSMSIDVFIDARGERVGEGLHLPWFRFVEMA
jgi:hypothetical protein